MPSLISHPAPSIEAGRPELGCIVPLSEPMQKRRRGLTVPRLKLLIADSELVTSIPHQLA